MDVVTKSQISENDRIGKNEQTTIRYISSLPDEIELAVTCFLHTAHRSLPSACPAHSSAMS